MGRKGSPLDNDQVCTDFGPPHTVSCPRCLEASHHLHQAGEKIERLAGNAAALLRTSLEEMDPKRTRVFIAAALTALEVICQAAEDEVLSETSARLMTTEDPKGEESADGPHEAEEDSTDEPN